MGFVTFKPDTSSWMNYNGNKSIANISISNASFAGNLLLLSGELEPWRTERVPKRILVLVLLPLYSPCSSFALRSITPSAHGWLSLSPRRAAEPSEGSDLGCLALFL